MATNSSNKLTGAESAALTNEPKVGTFLRASTNLIANNLALNIQNQSSKILKRSLASLIDANNINNNNEADDDFLETSTTLSTTRATDNSSSEQPFADQWSEFWSREPFPSGYTISSITILACFITVIIFLIVVGNLLVCIAIFTEKSLKPTQNWFIASLAVSDMLLGAVVMPFSLARELMGFWIFGPLWCDIHEAMDVLLTTASINTLCLISLDRYWSITQAVSYLKKRTPRRGAFMIAFVWIFSAAVSLPPLVGWRRKQNASKQQQQQLQLQQQQPVEQSVPTTTSASFWTDEQAARKRRQANPSMMLTLIPNPELATPMLSIRAAAAAGPPLAGNLAQRSLTKQGSRRRRRRSEETEADSSFQDDLNALQEQQKHDHRQQLTNLNLNLNPMQQSLSTPAKPLIEDNSSKFEHCHLTDDLGYVLYSALGSFYIPCAVMVFTYVKIFIAARSRARRAISKQTRTTSGGASGQSSAKRQHGRLRLSNAANRVIESPSKLALMGDAPLSVVIPSESLLEKQLVGSEPIAKGKIVIVERKKSLAACMPAPPTANQTYPERPLSSMNEEGFNTATYSCSDLAQAAAAAAAKAANASSDQANEQTEREALEDKGEELCTLTTSGAKRASPSALNSSNSSMITVNDAKLQETCNRKVQDQDEGAKKAAALLKAISLVNSQQQQQQPQLADDWDALLADEGQVEARNDEQFTPDIVVEQRRSATNSIVEVGATNGASSEQQNLAGVTNETCFMTIEEDSDMFDAQAGRTIMLIAGNATKKQTNNLVKSQGIMMTMLPPSQSSPQAAPNNGQVCNNAACRRQQQQATNTRSASSYCGSSMTINDEEIDDCVEDELLTDDCNGYSVSCGLDQYCQSAANCPHCQELCRDHANSASRHLSITDSPARLASKQQRHQVRCVSETENQSMTGDDNLSLTEYRSNEDSSSILGHDMLDASAPEKKKATNVPSAPNANSSESKKKSIGFRLSRLGSSAPLPSGGLLALANNQQQQQQQQQQQAQPGTRNLKALRQNFFLKLNQLTASKSVMKQENKNKKLSKSSPGGKSSAQSSGTSYEQSVDCPTTSNLHSLEYHIETTACDNEESVSAIDANQQRNSNARERNNMQQDQHKPTNIQQQLANNQLLDKNDDRALLLKSQSSNNNNNKTDEHSTTLDTNKSSSLIQDSGEVEHRRSKKGLISGHANSSTMQSSSNDTGARHNNNNTNTNNSKNKNNNTVSGGNKAYLASDNERHKRKLAKARERRATLILGLIMAAFICSWLPFFTFYVIRALCTECGKFVPPRLEAFIFWAGYCNSAINPIIYTIFNRDFRKAFRKLLLCK